MPVRSYTLRSEDPGASRKGAGELEWVGFACTRRLARSWEGKEHRGRTPESAVGRRNGAPRESDPRRPSAERCCPERDEDVGTTHEASATSGGSHRACMLHGQDLGASCATSPRCGTLQATSVLEICAHPGQAGDDGERGAGRRGNAVDARLGAQKCATRDKSSRGMRLSRKSCVFNLGNLKQVDEQP